MNIPFFDSFMNLVLGLGTPKDGGSQSFWLYKELDRNSLENLYRSNWLARGGVDCPAEDATREWRKWQGSDQQIDAIQALEKRFELQKKTRQALIRANLYGGAALVIGVNQGQPEEELDFEKVGKDDFKFIVVLNRYELNAGPRIYNVMSRWYTRPEYYTISTPLFGWYFEQGTVYPTNYGKSAAITPTRSEGQAPSKATKGNLGVAGQRPMQEEGDRARQTVPAQGLVRIHPSRVMEFYGNELPDWRLAPMGGGWGDSVIQTANDALTNFGLSVASMAAMMNDAKVDVFHIPDFTRNISTKTYRDQLIQRFSLANVAKSTTNALLVDMAEKWERVQTQFGGIPQVIDKLTFLATAAFKVPMSRMVGGAPSGALSTSGGSGGEIDLRNYYDRIAIDQKTKHTPIMEPLDECLVRSALGNWDKNVKYEWAPLYKPDPLEQAQVHLAKAQTTNVYVGTGLFNEAMLRTAALNQIQEDNIYPGIEDAIEEFGEEPDLEEIPMPSPAPSSGNQAPEPVDPMRRQGKSMGRPLENVAENQQQSSAQ